MSCKNKTKGDQKYVCIERRKEAIFLKKIYFVVWCLGAEPSLFSWTEDAPKRKAPLNKEPVLKSSKTTTNVEAEEFYIDTASSGGDTEAIPESTPEAVENTSPVDPEVDTIQSLHWIELFEQQVPSYKEDISRLENQKQFCHGWSVNFLLTT